MVKKIIGLGLVLCMLLTCAIMPASAAAQLTLEKNSMEDTKYARGICKTDKYLFLSFDTSIKVYDLKDPVNPTYLTTINSAVSTLNQVHGMFIKGDYLLVVYKSSSSRADFIGIYNVSQINAGETLQRVAESASETYLFDREMMVTLDGDTLYILTKDGLNTVDVSLAAIQAAEAKTIKSREDYAAGTIEKVTITNLRVTEKCNRTAALGKLATYTNTNGVAYGLEVQNKLTLNSAICKSGDYLYYTVTSNYGLFLGMLKVTDSGCEMVGYYPLIDYAGVKADTTPRCSGMVVKGDKVYVLPRVYGNTKNSLHPTVEPGTIKNRMYVLDAAEAKKTGTAATPVPLKYVAHNIIGGTSTTNSIASALAINGDQLYIWGSGKNAGVRGIHMYDLNKFAKTYKLEDFTKTRVYNATGEGFVNTREDHGDMQRGIVISGDIMYSIDYQNGLIIHRMPANEVTAPVVNNGTTNLDVLADGNLKAKTTITNYSSDDYSGLIIIAHYENVGGIDKLVDLKATPFSVPAGEIRYEVESEALAVSAGTSVKAMVWSNWTGIAPIVAPTTIN